MLRKNRKLIAVLFTLALFLTFTAAWANAQVPAKPAKFDYVFDYAGLIDPAAEQKISSLGRELDEKTSAQVVVVTVESLGDLPIEDYANTLFRSWGLGSKQKNNGVLLLVNKENIMAGKPGRVRIEVGYGLEGAIPDGKAGRILDNYVLPYWEQQKYSEGILQGYQAIAAEAAGEYNVTLDGTFAPVPANYSTGPTDRGSAPWVGLVVAIIMLSLFSAMSRRNRRRRNRWDDDDYGGGWGGWGGWGGGFGGGGGWGGGFGGGSSGGGGASR